jgi:hypothetical protein
VTVTLVDKIEARLRAIPNIRRILRPAALRRIALEAADVAREYADERRQPAIWCGVHGAWDCEECNRK